MEHSDILKDNSAREFKGLWIPKEVLYDNSYGLRFTEKGFLVEISSLQGNKERGCYASNKHFAAIFALTPERCSQIINELRKQDFITVSLVYENNAVKERNIFMTEKGNNVVTGVPFDDSKGIKDPFVSIKGSSGGIMNSGLYRENSIENIREETSFQDVITHSDECVKKPSPKIKTTLPRSEDSEKLVVAWCSKEELRKHKEGTGVWKSASFYFLTLLTGTFGKHFDINSKYMQDNGITIDDLQRTWTVEEIEKAIDCYALMMLPDYAPRFKDKLPKNCSDFIYNKQTRTSLLFSILVKGGEAKPVSETILNQEVFEIYKKDFCPYKLNDIEQSDLIRNVNFVVRRKEEYVKLIGKYSSPSGLQGNQFYRTHLQFLRERYGDRGVSDVNIIGNQTIWKQYVSWLKSSIGPEYELCPTNDMIERAQEKALRVDEKAKREQELDELYKQRCFDLNRMIPV